MTYHVQQGDCLRLLRHVEDGSVHLVYLDPPFNTGRLFTSAAGSFDDRWPSMAAYIEWMRERCVHLHRVLAPNGSFYLHCDPTASHYLRVMLDGIFGAARFHNAIAWKRTNAHNSGRKYGAVHDTLLFYGKGDDVTWNPPTPTPPATGTEPVGDVWLDIPNLNSRSHERRHGYPTQKPEALLARIISASSNPGDVVLDPFCGSGTTLVVAARLGRRWLGYDISEDACVLTRRRVADATARIDEVSA